MEVKKNNWEIQFNGQSVGKHFFTKNECYAHFNELRNRGLYGYTISKVTD